MIPPPGRRTLAWQDDERASTAFVSGGVNRLSQRVEGAKSAVQGVAKAAADIATGKVKLTTIYQEVKQTVEDAAQTGADLVHDPAKRREVARAVTDKASRLKVASQAWLNEPPEKQLEDVASSAGSGAVDLGISAGVGGATNIAGEIAGLADLISREKKAGEALAKAKKAEQRTAKGLHAAEGGGKSTTNAATAHAEQAARNGSNAAPRSRVQHMQANPDASGEHTTFVRDPKTNRVYKYQEWDKEGMPVRRADAGSNSSHPNPHTHHPAGADHMHTYTPPNRAPDGRLYPGSEAGARNLEPHEIPK